MTGRIIFLWRLNRFAYRQQPGLPLAQTYMSGAPMLPLLLITHGLGFRILLQRENEPVTDRVRETA